MEKLKQEVIEMIKSNFDLKKSLSTLFRVHDNTIERWLDLHDVRLTAKTALSSISEELGIEESELTEKV